METMLEIRCEDAENRFPQMSDVTYRKESWRNTRQLISFSEKT